MTKLTKEEWNEMNIIRKEMTENIQSVSIEKQERFTKLFVKSLNFIK